MGTPPPPGGTWQAPHIPPAEPRLLTRGASGSTRCRCLTSPEALKSLFAGRVGACEGFPCSG